jgi:hypothetical protein
MNITKKLFCTAACAALFSLGTQAQSSYGEVQRVVDQFNDGVITVDQAYTKIQNVYSDGRIHKCKTPLHMFEHTYKSSINPELLRDQTRTSFKSAAALYTSPSGKFEFTYETTGTNAVPTADGNSNGVPDFVEAAAISADSSYAYLVVTLGYTDPIPNGTTYEVSFLDMNNYGYAETYSNPGGPVSRIVLENDFVGFPDNDDPDGNQLGAVRATMAHEFKHAIQFEEENSDAFDWAEMDATLAEETVYDVVNDYYNYLGGSADVFGNPGTTVIPGSYEDVTWALFFHERYGSDFWPDAWDRIKNEGNTTTFLEAIEDEITSRGDTYTQALLELYAWHFAAGSYSNGNFGFDESSFYPTPSAQSNVTVVDDQFSNTINLGRFAAHMTNVVPPGTQTGTASVLVDTDDPDISLAVIAFFDNGTVSFEFAEEDGGFQVVSKGWQWEDIERLGVIVLNKDKSLSSSFQLRISDTFTTSIRVDNTMPTATELKQNYPNPFNPSTTIPVSISEFQRVKIDIYDMAGRLVQSVFDGNLGNGNYAIPVNMERFASGVYMYRLQTNDAVQIKRMTLVK